MNRVRLLLICLISLSIPAFSNELSTAPSQDLLGLYKQLRTIQVGGDSATTENVVLKRDAATFTFVKGRITFAAPVAGKVVAARFEGEGTFQFDPPSPIDMRQLSRFTRKTNLVDSFREAVFFFTDDSYQELSRQLKVENAPASDPGVFTSKLKYYSEELNDWIENRRKFHPSMRNLPARMLADMTDPESKGIFIADFKGKESGDLLLQISWNRDSILLSEYPKSDEVLLVHLGGRQIFEWWSGFHLKPEYAKTFHPDHRELLVHCPTARIELKVAKSNDISASALLEYTVQTPLRVIPFNLNGVLRIGAVEDSAGKPISFIQEPRNLDSDPWLILPEAAKPGQTYKVKITYAEDSTRDSRIVSRQGAGLYYVTSRESWFPSFGTFEDRTFFELHASSPKNLTFTASGALISSQKEKDSLVTVWKSELPLSVIGFNYGNFAEATMTANKLTVTSYSGKEVPDELKQIEHLKSQYELAGRNFEQETGILTSGLNTAANVKNAAAISLQAFQYYEFLFGELPFKKVAVTQQPVMGYGQSWPNLVFLPYDVFLDATTRNSLGLQDQGEQREFYSIVHVHEMAHQWWGHLVGWKTYHDQWLSEGVAEFASSLYLRQFQRKDLDNFWSIRRKHLLSRNVEGVRPVDAGPIWLNGQYADLAADQLLYHKGAYVMEMLRALMYDTQTKNPDARFLTMMHDFTATFAGRNASTEDFRQIVEKHTGRPMDWFFDQWVYGTYTPVYDFSYQLSDAGGGQTDLSIAIRQSEVPESFKMQLPLYAVINGQPQYIGLVGVSGNQPIKSNVKLPVRPDQVLLDPFRSILAEIRQ